MVMLLSQKTHCTHAAEIEDSIWARPKKIAALTKEWVVLEQFNFLPATNSKRYYLHQQQSVRIPYPYSLSIMQAS